jgi:indolepyruvate ferredoxin oxidoreductase alpha subunit
MEMDWCNWFAEGLVKNGCQYLSLSLMEGAENIDAAVQTMAAKLKFPLQVEQTISEKIGYEVALTYSYGKKRSAFLTQGFSLPVAMDPLMSSIYTGVAGGFVVLTLDETPAPAYSSKCDPVSLALFAKMPVLELSEFDNFPEALKDAYRISESFETPVMLHIDLKIPSRPYMPKSGTGKKRRTDFVKNTARWAATPRFRFLLHKKLNQRLKDISESGSKGQITLFEKKDTSLGIICNHANQAIVLKWAESRQVPVLSVQMPFPLPVGPVTDFIKKHKRTILIEDRFPTIQLQLPNRSAVVGRMTDERFKHVFSWQEASLSALLDAVTARKHKAGKGEDGIPDLPVAKTALAGFLSDIREKDKNVILCADRTPDVAGLPADFFVSRGGAISVAAGFRHASGESPSKWVLGITDTSAFFHYGIQATINAIYNTAGIKLIVLVKPNDKDRFTMFLEAMNNVRVVPFKPDAPNAYQALKKASSHLITLYTVPLEEAA